MSLWVYVEKKDMGLLRENNVRFAARIKTKFILTKVHVAFLVDMCGSVGPSSSAKGTRK